MSDDHKEEQVDCAPKLYKFSDDTLPGFYCFAVEDHNQKYRHGVLAKEKMEKFGKEKSLIYDQGHQQAAKGKVDDEAFGEIHCCLERVMVVYLREVQFLGHVINGNGIHVDPSKIEAKCKTFDWGEEPELTFQTLKDKLCNAPVLSLLDEPEDFVVYCDASGLGLGCVLMQRELFSDYDCEIRYHPGKANVVVDALSRKERVKPKRIRAIIMTLQSSIKDRILAAQKEAVDESAGLQKGLDEMIEQRSDRTLYYLDRIWVPLKGDVRTLIMDEAHKSKYSVHPRADKMYYDLRDRLRLNIRGHPACCSNLRFPNGNGKG
ncbi:putative reverse transcriptase domain-containing protein [Tanacetum coccineum]